MVDRILGDYSVQAVSTSSSKGVGCSSTDGSGGSNGGDNNTSNNTSSETSNEGYRDTTVVAVIDVTTDVISDVTARDGTVVSGRTDNVNNEAALGRVANTLVANVGWVADDRVVGAGLFQGGGSRSASVNSAGIIIVTVDLSIDVGVDTTSGRLTGINSTNVLIITRSGNINRGVDALGRQTVTWGRVEAGVNGASIAVITVGISNTKRSRRRAAVDAYDLTSGGVARVGNAISVGRERDRSGHTTNGRVTDASLALGGRNARSVGDELANKAGGESHVSELTAVSGTSVVVVTVAGVEALRDGASRGISDKSSGSIARVDGATISGSGQRKSSEDTSSGGIARIRGTNTLIITGNQLVGTTSSGDVTRVDTDVISASVVVVTTGVVYTGGYSTRGILSSTYGTSGWVARVTEAASLSGNRLGRVNTTGGSRARVNSTSVAIVTSNTSTLAHPAGRNSFIGADALINGACIVVVTVSVDLTLRDRAGRAIDVDSGGRVARGNRATISDGGQRNGGGNATSGGVTGVGLALVSTSTSRFRVQSVGANSGEDVSALQHARIGSASVVVVTVSSSSGHSTDRGTGDGGGDGSSGGIASVGQALLISRKCNRGGNTSSLTQIGRTITRIVHALVITRADSGHSLAATVYNTGGVTSVGGGGVSGRGLSGPAEADVAYGVETSLRAGRTMDTSVGTNKTVVIVNKGINTSLNNDVRYGTTRDGKVSSFEVSSNVKSNGYRVGQLEDLSRTSLGRLVFSFSGEAKSGTVGVTSDLGDLGIAYTTFSGTGIWANTLASGDTAATSVFNTRASSCHQTGDNRRKGSPVCARHNVIINTTGNSEKGRVVDLRTSSNSDNNYTRNGSASVGESGGDIIVQGISILAWSTLNVTTSITNSFSRGIDLENMIVYTISENYQNLGSSSSSSS